MLEYKDYVGKIAYDEVADVLYATVINSGPYSVAEAEATNVESVKREFRKSIDCTWPHVPRMVWSRFRRQRYLSNPRQLLDSSTPYEK